jgi:LmbE family N-acetylglucosaminyl deacetylase
VVLIQCLITTFEATLKLIILMKKVFFSIFFLVFFFQINFAQQPKKYNSTEIFSQIQKLNFLGSVLYIAAHPDDENTRLITYLANNVKAETAYLSLTRGDGGQNLIGPELRELLGTIRTQELLEARKIDGGEQFFSRANDFGYSKNPSETLEIWDKNEVLSDVVWIIRKFQPDVIINRFDHRSPGTTHGHHTSSAMLSVESFDLTNNDKIFPEQLKLVAPWQPKRLFFNTSWWFYGSQENFDKADKINLLAFKTGVFYPELGKSNQEIAALSRSRHQSQGFGSTGTRGEETEYLELLKGQIPKDKTNIFDGIDTTWNRVEGGAEIGQLLSDVEKKYDFQNPTASINDLVKAYNLIQRLKDEHWKKIKSVEITGIIAACAGLYLEAVAEKQEATIGENIKLKLEAINRSAVPMTLVNYTNSSKTTNEFVPIDLKCNILQNLNATFLLAENLNYTQPYWLKETGSVGMYRVDEQQSRGIPDVIREVKVVFDIKINNTIIPFERNVIYKFNDEVKGEVYKPFDIIPAISISFIDKVKIFNTHKTKTIGIKLKAGKDNVDGNLTLDLPSTWLVSPKSISFNIDKKETEKTFYFEVTSPKQAEEVQAKATAKIDNQNFDKERITINYEHISVQQVLKPCAAHFLNLDIKTGNEKVAYIMGAGDEVPQYLEQMGYTVTILKPAEITKENLAKFDVAITGIRAYNTVEELAFKQSILLDFVKEGGTMIVQYNTNGKLVTKDIAPFLLKISRDRVTEENAEVRFLDPKNTVLNLPNKLDALDFTGWVQEQGLYYPEEWDKNFKTVISSNDKGEKPKDSAILVADYGKGHYIYTGLSFFRELPAGVAGAYKLFANLISIGKN